MRSAPISPFASGPWKAGFLLLNTPAPPSMQSFRWPSCMNKPQQGFETIDAAEAESSKEENSHPSKLNKFRLHVTPDAQLVEQQSARNGSKLCPVILDSPNDAATTTGEMLRRLCDHVLPAGVEDVQLAVSTSGEEAYCWLGGNEGILSFINPHQKAIPYILNPYIILY